MARKKNSLSIVVDYENLSDHLKAIYDQISFSYDDKNIYDVRDEAAEMGVESPTMLGKEELVKRIVDKMLARYLPPSARRDYKPWSLFKDLAGDESIRGFCECHDGEWFVGRTFILPTIAKEHCFREGDLIEGKVADINGAQILVSVISLENDGVERKWFSDICTAPRRPFYKEGTAADELLSGLQVGERVIMKSMSVEEANAIAESFENSVKLFLGFPPEYESNIDTETFVTEFALGKAETASVVRLSLERCKRLAEMGKDVVFVIKNFESLDDFDAERGLFGVGRCFISGGVTVIADMDADRRNGAFAKIATRIIA